MEGRFETLMLVRGLMGKPRSGWLKRGVPAHEAETVATHIVMGARACYIYAMTRPELGLDVEYLREVFMAHDIPECAAPDYTPEDNIPKERKFQGELAVMDRIAALGGEEGRRLRTVWLDYEHGTRPEIVVAHDMDKADPCVRALEYIARGYPDRMGEFYPHARSRIRTEDIGDCLDRLYETRESQITPYARWFSLLATKGERIDVFPNNSALYR